MLSENEILDRHQQALGEARRACQHLGRNADPEYLAPRGAHYAHLTRSLKALEGSCRQMAHFRSDARWLRLGIHYARQMRTVQAKFVGQQWAWFNEFKALFELGERRLAELRDAKTGVSGAILPKRASEWLILPDTTPVRPAPPRFLN